MAAYKLLLLPADPLSSPLDCEQLATELQTMQLIGPPVALGENVFYPAGEQFLQQISFLGCSPMIELEPPTDPAQRADDSTAGKFCHVFLHCHPVPGLRADSQSPAPRCPQCSQPLADWQAVRTDWLQNGVPTDWSCSHCGHQHQAAGLSFRKAAGIAHTFIEIRGIYPSEAVPTDALLKRLTQCSGGQWKTIYIKE